MNILYKNNEEVPLMPEQSMQDFRDFQTLYQDNLSLIYRYVYSKVGNREEAEDLTSQIFIKAIRNIHVERGIPSIRKWLFQVARTTIADFWQARSRITTSSLEALLEAGWEDPIQREAIQTNSYLEEQVQQILQALPKQHREVLNCRFLLGFSVRETAMHLSLTESHVKVLQYRALRKAAKLECIVSKT